MRKQLGKRVRERFSRSLSERLPQFKASEAPFPGSGDRLYAWSYAGDLTFYIYLQMNPKWDGFYIELGWSRHGRWPAHLPPNWSPDEPIDGEIRVRLEQIIDRNARHSLGWYVVPLPALDDVMAYINPPPAELFFDRADELVDLVIGHIVEAGMAYFRQVAPPEGGDLGRPSKTSEGG